MRLNSGATSVPKEHGPGGRWKVPMKNKWLKYINNTTDDHFIPENSTAEKRASYDRAPVTKMKGRYTHGGYVYKNTMGFGTGPCWRPNASYATHQAPPGCASGWTDDGTEKSTDNFDNSNDYNGSTANPHGNPFHMGTYINEWGCPDGWYHKIWVRYCRV